MSRREGLPAFRQLCAEQQLCLLGDYPRLIPRLMAKGLSLEDGAAVAYNAALLYRVAEVVPPLKSPADVLNRYSLGEIADLCEAYRLVAAGDLEYGGQMEQEEKGAGR